MILFMPPLIRSNIAMTYGKWNKRPSFYIESRVSPHNHEMIGLGITGLLHGIMPRHKISPTRQSLIRLPLDKTIAISADGIFNWIFFNKNIRIPIKMSLKYFPRSPIDHQPAVVQVMAWCRTDHAALGEAEFMCQDCSSKMCYWRLQ